MGVMSVQSFLLRAALPLCVVVSLAQQAPSPVHLVIVSVDGLMPSAYTGPDSAGLPTLRSLAREGAYAEGVVGVVPSVTYASHTTLITGVPPAVHGVSGNAGFAPGAHT